MKIKINALFVVLALIEIFLGQAHSLILTFVAVSLHELGHSAIARTRGYLTKSIEIMPFGAVMSLDDNMDKMSGILVGIAGPIVNLILCLFTLGIWWLVPSLYGYTQDFLNINLSLALFNLLPAYPLDGGRVVVSMAKNKIRAVKGIRIAGVVFGIIFIVLFIVSFFYECNFSLAIIGIFLIYGGVSESAEEEYISIFSPNTKDYKNGVEYKKIALDGSVPLARLFRFVSINTITTFEIATEYGSVEIDENTLYNMAVGNKLNIPIYRILKDERCSSFPLEK